jgi:hypothetical protein
MAIDPHIQRFGLAEAIGSASDRNHPGDDPGCNT